MFDPIENVKELLRKAAHVNKNASLNCVQGEIVSVSDPDKKGRCQVRLINFSSSEQSYISDWSKTLGNTVQQGLLPQSLIGKTVLVFPISNSYEELTININSALIYDVNEELPEPSKKNLGLKIIVVSASEAFDVTCLLRNGSYIWENTCPLKHGHEGGDTQEQFRDSGGDMEMPIEQLAINDKVFATGVIPYSKNGALPPIIS